MRILLAITMISAAAGTASAWDGPQLWYERADAANPGGGGIFGTGGQHDHGITCMDCHTERVDNGMTLDLAFQPALGDGNTTYRPGQRYRVDVTMLGETLGPPCDQYMTHTNNFAASFEDDAGAAAGALESDSGQSRSNCPADYTMPASGTTALYRDCAVIFSKGVPDTARWTFYWTAPASGNVRLYWGAVDGDCSMRSTGDAVTVDRRTLTPAPMLAPSPPVSPPRRSPSAVIAVISALAACAILGTWWRRRSRSRR